MTDLKKLYILVAFFTGISLMSGQNLNTVGLLLLRQAVTNIDGSGIRVAQIEATETAGATNFEVNPGTVGVASNLFTYISGAGTATNFPNSVGGESTHAHDVAGNFYGSVGLATNVAHVDNYYEGYFEQVSSFPFFSVTLPSFNINDPIANASYAWTGVTVSEQQTFDSAYDNYAAQYGTLFVCGLGNGGPPDPPSTCYNGIGVADLYGASSIGPTSDNGRSKPDLTAPAAGTSYTAPQVAGAAADLMQAGLRGDGGSDTNSAVDMRNIKALLLNGAIKPVGWTNLLWTNNARLVLDTNYGAGVLNVFNSYEQLAGGKHNYNFSTNVPVGTAHPPIVMTNTIAVLSAWDFNTNTSGSGNDGVNHYLFNVSNTVAGAKFTATATLVWNRQNKKTSINNLSLFLYNCANSNLVACSTSLVDNVQHIYLPALPQGRYDLQVWKAGGSFVSASEAYALAWTFYSDLLKVTKSGTNLNLTWPVYPAGFAVATTTNLTTPLWSTNNLSGPVFTNNQNSITIPATNGVRFFRLQMPNF